MTEFYQFAGSHPGLTFLLAVIAAITACSPFGYAFRAWNRYMRSRNIAAHGWPPPHCDADGELATTDEDQ